MKKLVFLFVLLSYNLFGQVSEPSTGAKTERNLNGSVGYIISNLNTGINASVGYYLKLGTTVYALRVNDDGTFQILSDTIVEFTGEGILVDTVYFGDGTKMFSGDSYWKPYEEEAEYFDKGLEYSSHSDTSDFIAKVDRIGFEYNDDTLIIDNSGDIRLMSSGSHTILGKTSYDGLGSWWNTAIGANVGRNSLLVTDNTITGANSGRTSSAYTPAEINGCTLNGYNNYWTQGGGQLETCIGIGQYNMNRLRDGINNMWLGQGIYQDPASIRMDLNNRFFLGMPATDDGSTPMLDSNNVLLFGRFSPARRANQFLRINGNLQVEGLIEGTVPFINEKNELTHSYDFTWDVSDGLYVGRTITSNDHINFKHGGNILTINENKFISIEGVGKTSSLFGLRTGQNSFLELNGGVESFFTAGFGTDNFRYVLLSRYVASLGVKNFYGNVDSTYYFLQNGVSSGNHNFESPSPDLGTIELTDFSVLGNSNGNSITEGGYFSLIGQGLWNNSFDNDTSIINEMWIGGRTAGNNQPTYELPHIKIDLDNKYIDLYAENGVTVNGESIGETGNQFANIGDTVLQTMAALAIGCSNTDSLEQLKVVGDINVVGTGKFLHLEVADGIDMELNPLPADSTVSSNNYVIMTAGTNLIFHDVCYVGSDGKMEKADANEETHFPMFMATEVVSENSEGLFITGGYVCEEEDWNFTVGGIVYLSETPGQVTQTRPTTSGACVRIIGIAMSADVMYFKPSFEYVKLK
jgi:hypothetical protein